MHIASQIDISAYLHYRDVLQDIYEKLKAEQGSYNYKRYSEDLGLSFSNVIWLYVSKKRRMTLKTAEKTFKALGLSGDRKKFAENMVRLETIKIHEKREKIYADLFQLKTKMSAPENQKHLEFYSQWFFPALREIVQVNPKLNINEICERFLFKVFPREIEQGLQVLSDLELIKYDKVSKTYRSTKKQIGLDYKTSAVAAARFHQKSCELASEAVVHVSPEMRELNTLTLALSQADIPEVRRRIIECCRGIFELEEHSRSDQVFQLNIQFFPITDKLDPEVES